jgi:hypothetical protein
MRKLRIMEHISLDGVIQHSADDDDFPYSDWTAPYRTPAGRDAILAAHGGSFDLLLGRRTYDLWSGFWPKATSSPMADGINAATKYIATHHPESLEWGPFEGLGPDSQRGATPEDKVRTVLRLDAASALDDAEGTPPRSFELVSTKAMPSGIILSHYKLAGPLKTG